MSQQWVASAAEVEVTYQRYDALLARPSYIRQIHTILTRV